MRTAIQISSLSSNFFFFKACGVETFFDARPIHLHFYTRPPPQTFGRFIFGSYSRRSVIAIRESLTENDRRVHDPRDLVRSCLLRSNALGREKKLRFIF